MEKTQEQVDALLLLALSTWGERAQMQIAIEECGEFIAALSQKMRGRDSDVISEIADVVIVMRQMSMMFGNDAVYAAIESKINRLEARLGKVDA